VDGTPVTVNAGGAVLASRAGACYAAVCDKQAGAGLFCFWEAQASCDVALPGYVCEMPGAQQL
jgi:hypothetical protein